VRINELICCWFYSRAHGFALRLMHYCNYAKHACSMFSCVPQIFVLAAATLICSSSCNTTGHTSKPIIVLTLQPRSNLHPPGYPRSHLQTQNLAVAAVTLKLSCPVHFRVLGGMLQILSCETQIFDIQTFARLCS